MKKSIAFLLASVIALGISLSACAQSSVDHQLPGIELVSSDMSAPVAVDMIGTSEIYGSTDELISFNIGTTAAYDPGFTVKANLQNELYPFDRGPNLLPEDMSEWNLTPVMIDQIPLNESFYPLSPNYYNDSGELQSNIRCIYLVPISKKDAKRMFKQMRMQSNVDNMVRPPSRNYINKL